MYLDYLIIEMILMYDIHINKIINVITPRRWLLPYIMDTTSANRYNTRTPHQQEYKYYKKNNKTPLINY